MTNNENADQREIQVNNNEPNVGVEPHGTNDLVGPVKLPKKERMKVFAVLTAMMILVNMDHGTIPAATTEIKRDMNISDTTLGAFGSLVFLGCFLGSFLLTKLIDHFSRRLLCIITMFTNAFLLWSFTEINFLPFLFVNRVLVGIMQSYITIYYPVWVDQYGMRTSKTIMMSIFNITSPLGVIFGYVLTMMIKVYFDVSNILTIYSGDTHIQSKSFC